MDVLQQERMLETQFYHISQAGELVCLATLAEALASIKKGGFIWLNYCQPTKDELFSLIEPLGLHPLSIEDCTDDNQIPKIDDYPQNTFILFNVFQYAHKKLSIYEVNAFIGDNFLVTVSGRDQENRPLWIGTDRLMKLDLESIKQGPAFLLYVLLDYIVDQKFVAIEALEEELNQAEDIILLDSSHFNPAELLYLRRDLLAVRKRLFHEREILVKICRKDCKFIGNKAIYHYRDVYDHLTKFFELTEASRDIVTSLMEMYLSMLNNNMAKAANETNITVRRLTFITTVFMPITLLAGIGGMSEWSMITGPENWKIAYPAFMAGMAMIGIINYYILKWFEEKHRNGKE
ncbi:MAG: magnesium transporter CorA family protein [Pseudomonadota bacterium]